MLGLLSRVAHVFPVSLQSSCVLQDSVRHHRPRNLAGSCCLSIEFELRKYKSVWCPETRRRVLFAHGAPLLVLALHLAFSTGPPATQQPLA
jgi:hypothetical protein